MHTVVSKYYDRPYLVIHADTFVKQIRKAIQDPVLRRMPLMGSVDQLIDNEDVTLNADMHRSLGLFFDAISAH